MTKKMEPRLVFCENCKHAKPVTHEYPAWDGRPIFCTCEHRKYYHFMRHAWKCEYYEESM